MSAVAIADPWMDEWASQARCTSQDPDALFVRGKAQHDAKTVCKTCPVLAQCLAEALDNRNGIGERAEQQGENRINDQKG